MRSQNPALLRGALIVDAAVSGATGVLLAAGAGMLEELLSLPQGLLRVAGLSLLPFAAAVAYVATRDPLSESSVRVVVGLNGAWVVASIALLFSGRVSPNALGVAVILAQAIAVAVLADVQYLGLRRSPQRA